MDAEPLYPEPYRLPQPGNGKVPPPTAGTGGAASAVPLGGAGLPQVRVDYQAAARLKRQVSERLLAEHKDNTALVGAAREQRGRALINEAVTVWADVAGLRPGGVQPGEEQALAGMVFDMLFRAGRLQRLLDDPRIDNIYINGHDNVTVDLGDDQLVRVEPVADSEEELKELLRDLARTSGQSERTLSTANPMLALRLADGSRLQALGDEITGERTYVTIRRHRVQDATLKDLIGYGTLDDTLAAFLAACVRGERNIMIVGEQGSGKTSLLRALLREIPASERFGTLETEFELWAHRNGHHTQVVPMEARESNGERVDGRAAGEITLMDLMHKALRMSLTRIVVGEVRGPEITALMQALTNGRGGNLCTMHASGPHVVFDRIAELYLLAQGNFSEALAYRQIANGLHFIVFVAVDTTQGGKRRYISHVWEITGVGEGGRPAYNQVFGPSPATGQGWEVPEARAVALTPPTPATLRRLKAAGFDPRLLHPGAVHPWLEVGA
ncbi:ATP/GTP-binding protein [Streptomyces spiroverticillatus]|uniref:ATP/GTP-binding protein n=1 Tax=Streptomyces finlayi TaxID=67296 RepID=A0A919CFW3_9ACTN|nr:ATPase, T2SS/T4P/T4SS family [Streptomyces finlayi]GHA47998.1 ATP/GTP-binding protein [Streptomyces spiroverticillatus]GHD18863.1 ATP/GTP-binding protein [Streptomyces finlayi]